VQAERLARGDDQPAAARVSVVRVLGHRSGQDGIDLLRQVGVVLARSRRRLLDVRPEDGQLGVALEGRLPGQAFVEQAAERVQIGPAVDRCTFDLLR